MDMQDVALKQALAQLAQLQMERDVWRSRAQDLNNVCSTMQVSLTAMGQALQKTIPFKAHGSAAEPSDDSTSIAAFMVRHPKEKQKLM